MASVSQTSQPSHRSSLAIDRFDLAYARNTKLQLKHLEESIIFIAG
jgi:hypothetical protein